MLIKQNGGDSVATEYHFYKGYVKFPYFGENELEAFRESDFAKEIYDRCEGCGFGVSPLFDNVMDYYYNEIYTGENEIVKSLEDYMKEKGAIYLTTGYRQDCMSDGSEIFLGSFNEVFVELNEYEKEKYLKESEFQEEFIKKELIVDEYEEDDDGVSVIEW